MDVELHEHGSSKAEQAPDKPSFKVQDDDNQQIDERMGLLDDADKTLSLTNVEAFRLPDIFQVRRSKSFTRVMPQQMQQRKCTFSSDVFRK